MTGKPVENQPAAGEPRCRERQEAESSQGDPPKAARPAGGGYMDELRRLVLDFLWRDDVAVYLFGSRARGDNDPGSDVDIGILPKGPLPRGRLALLKSELEESNIPYRVEIVNLAEVSQEFRRHAMKEAVAWKI